jgi:hypothetical protein
VRIVTTLRSCNRALVVALDTAAIASHPHGPFLEHATLDSFPAFNQRHEADHASKNQTPLPSQRHVSENDLVDDRDVDDGERGANTCNDGPEQEAILEQRVDDGERTGIFFRIHVEQATGQMFRFPCHDAEQDCQDAVRCGASTEGEVAGRIVAVVAVVPKVAVASAVDYYHEANEAQRAHASAVNEFVDNQLFGEDSGAKAVRRPGHDV